MSIRDTTLVISGNQCHSSPRHRAGLRREWSEQEDHAMTTRDELLEALDHHSATRQRLSTVPGTHGLRAEIIIKIDEILDQLHDLDHQPQPVG